MAKRGARYADLTEREKQLKRDANKAWRQRHPERVNAIKRSYRQKNGDVVRAYHREYDRFYRRKLRQAERRRYYANHAQALEARRRYYHRTRQQEREEEQRIAAVMVDVERDATALGIPDPERLGIFKKQKDIRKRAVGKTPAQTVSYRLAARKGEALLTVEVVQAILGKKPERNRYANEKTG